MPGRGPHPFVLVHSPLVGPASWRPVAEELERLGRRTEVPDLDGAGAVARPHWLRHVRAAAAAARSLPSGSLPVLVGHSGAGVLLPAIRTEAGRPVAVYLFVDAGLPRAGARRASGEFARTLRELHAAGGRYPSWTDDDLRELVPDPERRRLLLSGMRPQPPEFWAEAPPVPPGWPDAPCAYLRFPPNPAYDAAAAAARRRGWPCRELPGGHFHALVAPGEVAAALVDLVETAVALRP